MEHLLTREYLWKHALTGVFLRKVIMHPNFERGTPSLRTELRSALVADLSSATQRSLEHSTFFLYYTMG